MTPWHGRARELAALRQELDRDGASLIVILGRRRVGKTRLILEAVRDRPTVYYQATKIAAGQSLGLFKGEAARLVGSDPVLAGLADWPGVVSFLEGVARDRMAGLTVVLDGFPYLCEVDPSLPSVLQKAWDRIRDGGTRLNLVLCGSKVSFMEELLGDGPLHGRQTLELDVAPLPFRDAARFFAGWSPQERALAYGVFGGMPYYLALCDPGATLAANIRALVLSMGAPLADEPVHLLQAELRDVTRYATLLRSMAEGCTTTGDILGRVRDLRDSSALSPYVQKLEELRLIRVVRSLDASERVRGRRYYLDDPFLAFWYRFCLPNASPLAAGHADEVWERAIAPQLDAHMGGVFEWICRDYVRLFAREILPAPAEEVGQIWGKDHDIDVAGRLLDGTRVAGECTWREAPVGVDVLARLEEATTRTPYYAGHADDEPYLLLFSSSGFTADLEARRDADPRVRLLGPTELLLA